MCHRSRHLKIAAIGPATRKAIEQHGLQVTVTPKEYVAESVVAALHRRVKGKRVLLVRAKVARDVIPRELRKAGAMVDVVEAYETVAPKSSAEAAARRSLPARGNRMRSPSPVPRRCGISCSLLGLRGARATLKKSAPHHGVHTASIGPVTSATLREFGLPVDIEAREYTIPGLVAAIVAKRERIRGAQSQTR